MGAKPEKVKPPKPTPDPRRWMILRAIDDIGKGANLSVACAAQGVTPYEMLDRCATDPDIANRYKAAWDKYADQLFDDIAKIEQRLSASTSSVEVQALTQQIKSIQWRLSKIKADAYGDKPTTAIQVNVNVAQLSDADLARIASGGK